MSQRFFRGQTVRFKGGKEEEKGLTAIIQYSKSDVLFNGEWFFQDISDIFYVMVMEGSERWFLPDISGDELELVSNDRVEGERLLQLYKEETLAVFEKDRVEVEERVRREHPGLFMVRE